MQIDSEYIASWTDTELQQRIILIARKDGTYSYFLEYYIAACDVWSGRDEPRSYFDSKERTIADIHANHPWTKNLEPTDWTKNT